MWIGKRKAAESAVPMNIVKLISIIMVISALALASGCKKSEQTTAVQSDVLLSISDSSLLLVDVAKQIPPGLSPEDSAAMFTEIVNNWVKSMLLENIAKENIRDLSKIDKMTSDYRNRLIIMEYMRSMTSTGISEISEKDVKKYYTAHRDDFILDRPIVKGVYLKVPASSERLSDLRNWMKRPVSQNIDKLEHYGLKSAVEYDYFQNKWIDWQLISDRIPYQFGNADSFVSQTKNFDVEVNGSIFLLHISDYIPSGEEMPYEFAVPQIREILLSDNRDAYEANLLSSIYAKAEKEGKIVAGIYDFKNRQLRKFNY